MACHTLSLLVAVGTSTMLTTERLVVVIPTLCTATLVPLLVVIPTALMLAIHSVAEATLCAPRPHTPLRAVVTMSTLLLRTLPSAVAVTTTLAGTSLRLVVALTMARTVRIQWSTEGSRLTFMLHTQPQLVVTTITFTRMVALLPAACMDRFMVKTVLSAVDGTCTTSATTPPLLGATTTGHMLKTQSLAAEMRTIFIPLVTVVRLQLATTTTSTLLLLLLAVVCTIACMAFTRPLAVAGTFTRTERTAHSPVATPCSSPELLTPWRAASAITCTQATTAPSAGALRTMSTQASPPSLVDTTTTFMAMARLLLVACTTAFTDPSELFTAASMPRQWHHSRLLDQATTRGLGATAPSALVAATAV
mmetsp:Transcript_22685/g.33167  ORF Transcript_22685/g.33167 Transcript_22685/m.33167 type:complete len:364 (+) Transcript_22685:3170-4261(+)